MVFFYIDGLLLSRPSNNVFPGTCCGVMIMSSPFFKLVFNNVECYYSSTCHERPPPVQSESAPSWQVAAGYRDINMAKTVQLVPC